VRVDEAINAAVAAPAFRSRLVAMGFTPLGGTTERFTTTMKDDIVRWGEVVKFSGAKVD
jgi:tripartite-type tricarboxylate transporter receptor subunit TctC